MLALRLLPTPPRPPLRSNHFVRSERAVAAQAAAAFFIKDGEIDKIEPGQTLEFTMHPDPILADLVHYYSCFALGDETIVPLNTLRNGERFDFRYDSTASFVVKGFDETGTNLSILGRKLSFKSFSISFPFSF